MILQYLIQMSPSERASLAHVKPARAPRSALHQTAIIIALSSTETSVTIHRTRIWDRSIREPSMAPPPQWLARPRVRGACRSGQRAAAAGIPRSALRRGTAPRPACASLPPAIAVHYLRRGPSWLHTRDAPHASGPAARPRSTAIAASAHGPA